MDYTLTCVSAVYALVFTFFGDKTILKTCFKNVYTKRFNQIGLLF